MKCFGLDLEILPTVYEPAEDSFMLANAAIKLKGKILEIGCGSGLVSLVCAKAGNPVLGVDINPNAVKCAIENAKKNKIKTAKFIRSDLFSKVPKTQFDAILFNPPYLPTSTEEKIGNELNHAFDGGSDGMSVINKFLGQVDDYLKHKGTLFLVISTLNDQKTIVSRLKQLGYVIDFVAEEKFFFEKLFLARASKP